MFNKRKAERELLYAEINRLKKINEKLEDENKCLRRGMEDIEKYRDKYKDLIESLEIMKKRYEKQLDAFDRLHNVYIKESKKFIK